MTGIFSRYVMMPSRVSMLALGMAALLSACSPSIQVQAGERRLPPPKQVTISEDDNGRIISLNTGDTLVVVLNSNPSTGYSWEVRLPAMGVLEQIGEARYSSGGNMPGSGGTVTMRFRAVRWGWADLLLVYRRPFENTGPVETFAVTVSVR